MKRVGRQHLQKPQAVNDSRGHGRRGVGPQTSRRSKLSRPKSSLERKRRRDREKLLLLINDYDVSDEIRRFAMSANGRPRLTPKHFRRPKATRKKSRPSPRSANGKWLRSVRDTCGAGEEGNSLETTPYVDIKMPWTSNTKPHSARKLQRHRASSAQRRRRPTTFLQSVKNTRIKIRSYAERNSRTSPHDLMKRHASYSRLSRGLWGCKPGLSAKHEWQGKYSPKNSRDFSPDGSTPASTNHVKLSDGQEVHVLKMAGISPVLQRYLEYKHQHGKQSPRNEEQREEQLRLAREVYSQITDPGAHLLTTSTSSHVAIEQSSRQPSPEKFISHKSSSSPSNIPAMEVTMITWAGEKVPVSIPVLIGNETSETGKLRIIEAARGYVPLTSRQFENLYMKYVAFSKKQVGWNPEKNSRGAEKRGSKRQVTHGSTRVRRQKNRKKNRVKKMHNQKDSKSKRRGNSLQSRQNETAVQHHRDEILLKEVENLRQENLILHLGVEAAAVRIQSIQRGRLARKQRASQMQRNDSIRKRNERVNETADAEYKTLLHELERLKEEANILHTGEEAAATRIQSMHRGRKTRRMLQMRKSIGDRDKRVARDEILLKEVENLRQENLILHLGVEAAAVRIQSIQRGRLARKQRASQMQRNDSIWKRNERVNETADAEYKTLLHELERLKEEANILHTGEEAAATRIQSMHRGRKTRRMLQMRKSIGDRDKRVARAADEEYNKLLQELEIAKAESKALQYGQTLAATRIQSIQRGKVARKESRKIKQNRAATRLQKVERGRQLRKRGKQKHRRAAVRLQKIERGRQSRKLNEARRSRIKRNRAALRLQKIERGRQSRKLNEARSSRTPENSVDLLMSELRNLEPQNDVHKSVTVTEENVQAGDRKSGATRTGAGGKYKSIPRDDRDVLLDDIEMLLRSPQSSKQTASLQKPTRVQLMLELENLTQLTLQEQNREGEKISHNLHNSQLQSRATKEASIYESKHGHVQSSAKRERRNQITAVVPSDADDKMREGGGALELARSEEVRLAKELAQLTTSMSQTTKNPDGESKEASYPPGSPEPRKVRVLYTAEEEDDHIAELERLLSPVAGGASDAVASDDDDKMREEGKALELARSEEERLAKELAQLTASMDQPLDHLAVSAEGPPKSIDMLDSDNSLAMAKMEEMRLMAELEQLLHGEK